MTNYEHIYKHLRNILKNAWIISKCILNYRRGKVNRDINYKVLKSLSSNVVVSEKDNEELKISKKVCKFISQKLSKEVCEDEIGYISLHIYRLKQLN